MIRAELAEETTIISLKLDHEIKIALRDYLDIFYVAIYRIRLLIQMSKQIGDHKDQLEYQDLWGFFQNNLIISAVVVEIFSIFDRKSNSLIKQFQQKLKQNKIDCISQQMVTEWINQLEKYEKIRHKLFAHKDLNPPRLTTVMYSDFLKLLDNFEEQLLWIDSKYLPDIPPPGKSRITSKPSLDIDILKQFKKLLTSENQT